MMMDPAQTKQVHDMGPEMLAEAVELVTMAVDKHLTSRNVEAAAAMVKTSFDRKFGQHWHCVIGEGFGFEVTYQQKHLVYLFYGTLGVLCYKV